MDPRGPFPRSRDSLRIDPDGSLVVAGGVSAAPDAAAAHRAALIGEVADA